MPLLTLPLALIALAALPALVAIYWLRHRLKRQEVSSLHLWLGQREAREGGQRVQRMSWPWLLLLELLILLLLVLAATDPRLLLGQPQRPLVVVLDDSYSMQAGGRQRALAELERQINRENPLAVRLILAGVKPRSLSSMLMQPSQVREALEGWRCHSPGSDLPAAIALAYELGGEAARVLVLTDQPPEDPARLDDQARLVWRALGQTQPNFAIINAVRAPQGPGHRVLIEVANLSDQAGQSTLRINGQSTELAMDAGEVRRLWLDLPDSAVTLRAELADDALPFDNAAVLLPGLPPPVRVGVDIADETLMPLVLRAAEAFDGAMLVAESPHLLLTDRQGASSVPASAWRVRWMVEEDPVALVGPFLMDDHHPLTQGLMLQGIVWAARQGVAMPGRPVVTAGDTPLVAVTDRPTPLGVRHDVTIRLNPSLSTLTTTPAFPVMMWNLLAWRQASLPGLAQANIRLGSQTTFTQGLTATSAMPAVATLTSPTGLSRSLTLHPGLPVVIDAMEPGVHRLTAGRQTHELAVNVMARGESDLTSLATISLGQWEVTDTLRRQYTSVAWALLLGALALMTAHAYLTWRSAGGTR